MFYARGQFRPHQCRALCWVCLSVQTHLQQQQYYHTCTFVYSTVHVHVHSTVRIHVHSTVHAHVHVHSTVHIHVHSTVCIHVHSTVCAHVHVHSTVCGRQTLINKQCICTCTYTITNMMAEVCEIRYRVKESTIVHIGELSKKVGHNEIRTPLGQWKSMWDL